MIITVPKYLLGLTWGNSKSKFPGSVIESNVIMDLDHQESKQVQPISIAIETKLEMPLRNIKKIGDNKTLSKNCASTFIKSQIFTGPCKTKLGDLLNYKINAINPTAAEKPHINYSIFKSNIK